MLKWYEPVGKVQLEWIEDFVGRETLDAGREDGRETLDASRVSRLMSLDERAINEGGATGRSLYEAVSLVLGSPRAASEFLYRAGIDGVKYPVDSYGGKGVKDGDKAGWNYVAFSDEHIRVDHKEQRARMVRRDPFDDRGRPEAGRRFPHDDRPHDERAGRMHQTAHAMRASMPHGDASHCLPAKLSASAGASPAH